MSAEPPAIIGPYSVLRPLGAGGMGEVFLAHDCRLDRRVAIKRIRPEVQLDREPRARFRREARLAAQLTHPNIVQIFDLPSIDGVDHIVMEYVPGTSLRRRLDADGPPPLPRLLAIAVDIARGLAYSHRRGVVHRDLKCENVLIGAEGEVKIADFGIARCLEGDGDSETLTRDGARLGTLRTMSPEQLRGSRVDTRADLFALGVLLYELATGRSPFWAAHPLETAKRIREHRPPPVDALDPRLPEQLSRLIDHLLEKEPALRPRGIDEVVARLEALAESQSQLDEETLESPPPEPREVQAPRPRPRRLPLVAAVLALAMLAAVVVWIFSGGLFSGDWPWAPAPRHVAVLEPEVAGEPSATLEAMSFLVRSTAVGFLTRLEGVFPRSRAEVDAIDGGLREIARAVAADELLEPSLYCDAAGCQLELSLVEAASGRVLWLDRGELPADEPLVAARAVEVLLRPAFARRRLVDDRGLEVDRQDFATYLEIRRAFGRQPGISGLEGFLERLAAVRQSSPRFVDAHVLEAEIALRHFRETGERASLARADQLGARAETLAPSSRAVLYLRFRLAVAGGLYEQAQAVLDRLAARFPGDPELLYHRSELEFVRGQLPAALATAGRAVERSPSWRYLYRHAALASRLGEVELARQSLAELLERSPRHYDGRELLARLEMTSGRLDRARRLYEELVAEHAGPTELGNLGNIYLLLGRPQQAAEIFGRLRGMLGDEPRSLLNLADARALAGQQQEAQQLYRQVLRALDEQPPAFESQALTVRAQALAHLGRGQEAVAAAHAALQAAPGDAQVAYEAALVFAVVGERHSALVNAKKALELGFAPIWFRYPWFEPLHTDPELARRLTGEP